MFIVFLTKEMDLTEVIDEIWNKPDYINKDLSKNIGLTHELFH